MEAMPLGQDVIWPTPTKPAFFANILSHYEGMKVINASQNTHRERDLPGARRGRKIAIGKGPKKGTDRHAPFSPVTNSQS